MYVLNVHVYIYTYIVKYKNKYQLIKQVLQDRMNLLCFI